MEKKPVYLIFVDGEFGQQGHNKEWNAIPLGDGTFKAEWGRVGASKQSKIYPMSKFESLIASKIKKGYVDRSNLMQDIIEDSKVETTPTGVDKFSLVKSDSVRNIIKRLFDFANQTIQSAYRVTAQSTTQAMVDTAQSIIDELSMNYKNMSVEDFNKKLNTLFITIPRKMKFVKDHLATSPDDFEKILADEQSLLDTMAGQVYQKKAVIETTESNEVPSQSILDEMGIEMEDATDEEVVMLKKAMGDSANKFYKAWKVKNIETEKAYNKFVGENNIGNVRLLCHGSRNQNIFNILKVGLKIRPSCAVYTGSMLGDALYFSNPDKEHGGVTKSVGYTSLHGYWSGENNNCGFLIFFDTALGNSYDIYNFDSRYYTYNLKKLQEDCPGAWSLHLHGAGYRNGSTVINDEITVYNTNQVTVRYLVEIR